MDLKKLLAMLRAFYGGAPLGDVLMLKLDALTKASESLTKRLERLRGYAPEQELSALRRMPPGTLGHDYAAFLDANGIEPLVISPGVKARFQDAPYALRYTTTHDLHHVLTGFDAGLAREAGVLAFTVGQGSAPVSQGMLWLVRALYSLIAPTQARRIWHNVGVGLSMGKDAELVLAEPLESYFEEPLEEVRKRLKIQDPRAAGVLPSRSSLIARLIAPTRSPRSLRAGPGGTSFV